MSVYAPIILSDVAGRSCVSGTEMTFLPILSAHCHETHLVAVFVLHVTRIDTVDSGVTYNVFVFL